MMNGIIKIIKKNDNGGAMPALHALDKKVGGLSLERESRQRLLQMTMIRQPIKQPETRNCQVIVNGKGDLFSIGE